MAKYWENTESKKLYWTETPESKRWNQSDDVSFYNSRAWRNTRRVKIATNPNCEMCAKIGKFVKGTVVDHIMPIRLGGNGLHMDNLQTLCTSCHNSKSAKERRLK